MKVDDGRVDGYCESRLRCVILPRGCPGGSISCYSGRLHIVGPVVFLRRDASDHAVPVRVDSEHLLHRVEVGEGRLSCVDVITVIIDGQYDRRHGSRQSQNQEYGPEPVCYRLSCAQVSWASYP